MLVNDDADEEPEEAGDGSRRSCESGEGTISRMDGESNGIKILKFVDGDANKVTDSNGYKQCNESIEVME